MKTHSKIPLILILICHFSCSEEKINGFGPVVTKELELAAFENIDFQVKGHVTIVQGREQSVLVSSQSNIIDRLNVNVLDNTWVITLGDGRFSYERFDVLITVPMIKNVSHKGSGSMHIEAFENLSVMEVSLKGSGDIGIQQLEGLSRLDVGIVGSGVIQIENQCTQISDLGVSISGSGNFYGFQIPTENCNVSIVGSGDINVSVSDQLDVGITGSGKVYYKGVPSISTNITGSGAVIDSN